MKHLYGVTTAMVTPFDVDGTVSLSKVEQLTEFLISKGVHCLYPLGTTGEMLRMTKEERMTVAETVVRRAQGRVTIHIHVGAVTQGETIELARHAETIGADGIGVVTPIFFGASDREMEAFYVTVASSVSKQFPVYLYNIPQLSGNDLTTGVAERIADRCKNVIGIKYSYPDFLRVNEYLTINDGRFSVVPGADRLFLPALAMGCEGVVSGVSCVYPEPFVAVYQAFQDNDLPKARRMQRLATKYCEVLRSGNNMAYFKEGLKRRGIDAGVMRAPQLDLPKEEAAELQAALNRLDQEASEIIG